MQTAYIAMGANLPSPAGSPEVTLSAAALRLGALGLFAGCASLYSTEPVGFAAQPRFLNTVIAIETEFEPLAVLQQLLAIERDYGRDRTSGVPNGPRTLDLDILLMGNLQIREPGLEIPHPRLAERAFVLVPLNEIASKVVVPGKNKTVAQLLQILLQTKKGKANAVVQVQSDIWCAGDRRGPGDSDTSLRTGAARFTDRHG